MFGFKSKRYKKLERINAMLEMELRRLQTERTSWLVERSISEATKKRVVPLHCSVSVDTMGYYDPENLKAYAKKEVISRLADSIGEYVTFEIKELDRLYPTNDTDDNKNPVTKYEVIGRVNVVEK